MRPEQIVDATFRARAVRDLRNAVLADIGHEAWRRLIRDTYPTSLSKVGRVWVERFGSGIDWTATDLYDEARREGWARGRVADAGHPWSTHLAKFSGAVLPREPDPWAGREDQVHMHVRPLTVTVAAAEEMVENAAWLLERAGRVRPVVVAPEDQDEVYAVQQRAGRMVACPRADAREVHAEHITGGRVCAGYGNQRASSRGL